MANKSKYKDHFPTLIYECITEKFMFLKDIAKVMNVNYDTLNEWLKYGSEHFKSELSESYHRALKDRELDIIEKTKAQLFKVAWGYEYEETKFDSEENVIYKIKKQAHPNAKACLAVLEGIQSSNSSITNKETKEMSEDELDRFLAERGIDIDKLYKDDYYTR